MSCEPGDHTLTTFDKWLDGIRPQDVVAEAALYAIKTRMAAVRHFVPLAAEGPSSDIENVHQLRVWTRRAVAALDVYRPVLPRKRTRRLRRDLRRMRRTAGNARDLDVLSLRLETKNGPVAKALDRYLGKRRKRGQRDVVKAGDRLERLRRRAEAVTSRAEERRRGPAERALSDWAPGRLAKFTESFYDAEPDEVGEMEMLHRFRIRGKALRYALELLAPAFRESESAVYTRAYPLIEQLQDHLGEVHDAVVLLDYLKQWKADEPDAVETEDRRAFTRSAKKDLARSLGEFGSWWTPELAGRLRAALDSRD